MKTLSVFFALLILVGCRSNAPIHDIQTSVPSSIIGDLNSKSMERIITTSAIARRWTVSQKAPGVLEGYLKTRGHEVWITINYNSKGYKISYKNSTNMRYKDKDHSIHPKYNRWIADLNRDIESRMLRQTRAGGIQY